jgi:type 1 glutamine amidotransferase
MSEMICVLKLAFLLVAVLCMLVPRQAFADDEWVVLDGKEGPDKGKHIVLVAGDDEYRSEELIPQLAKILAVHHGFRCTVLFATNPADGTITPNYQKNVPGLENLATADLLVIFTRFRELPDGQMKHIVDYTNSGKPITGLRTATHAFRYGADSASPYAKYSCTSTDSEGGWGRAVLGETWVSHHGHHNHESTRGVVADGMADHPILRGVEDIWGPSDVYTIRSLSGDSQPLVMGQVLTGMDPTDPPNPDKALMPVAWTKTYAGDAGKTCRVFATTMGHAGDFRSEGFRRLMVNGCYWALGMEGAIPAKSEVGIVGKYEPNDIGMGRHKPGLRPSDHRLGP